MGSTVPPTHVSQRGGGFFLQPFMAFYLAINHSSAFTPAAESHGLCPWMNAPAFGRDVAPLGREEGCHRLCPWDSTLLEMFQFDSCVLNP